MEQEKIIAGFRVLQNLQMGSGSQGTVYKAVCEEPREGIAAKGDVVALKVMFVQDEGQVQWRKLQKRTQELSRLDHPNVVRYRGCFNVSGPFTDMHVVVQEFLEGETLKDFLSNRKNGLDVDDALRIVKAAIEGLVYTSGCGIVHRDIKPGNIFLGIRDGKIESVKLIDFEIAKQEGGTVTTAAGNIRGSFDYMAPDFIDASFHGDVQSDVFSMGVVMHEMLTGKTPYQRFEGDSKQANFAFLSRWAQQPSGGGNPIHVSSRVKRLLAHADEVLAKALSPDRNFRFVDFKAFREAIGNIKYRDLRNGESTYRLLQFIGKGGFGEVFKARHRQTNALVAIKHLLKPEYAVRFFREARTMQKLDDPCFVRFVDFFLSEKMNGRDAFLVMEFLDGMPGNSLRDAIKNAAGTEAATLPQMDVLRAFHRYAHGLYVMHSKGIYHRDIKPSNLYYPAGHPDCAAIMDLGIARDVHGTVTQGQVPGTLDYMPPEVVVSDSRGDSGMDIYALGLCLYEALTGKTGYPRLPSGTEGLTAFFARARSGVGPKFEALPVGNDNGAEILRLLQEMTDLNVDKRLNSAAEVVKRLEALIRSLGGKVDLSAKFSPEEEDTLTETLVIDLPDDVHTDSTTPMKDELLGKLMEEKEEKGRRERRRRRPFAVASLLLLGFGAGVSVYMFREQIIAEWRERVAQTSEPKIKEADGTNDTVVAAVTNMPPPKANDAESEENMRIKAENQRLIEQLNRLTNSLPNTVTIAIPKLADGIVCLVGGVEATGPLTLKQGDIVEYVYQRLGYSYLGPTTYSVSDAKNQQLPAPSESDWKVKPVHVRIPRFSADVSCWIGEHELRSGSTITNLPGQRIECAFRRKGYKNVQKIFEVDFSDNQELPAPRFDEWELLPVTVSVPKLPDGMTCWIDGKEVTGSLSKKPGAWISVTYRRKGYADVTRSYLVATAETQTLPVLEASDWGALAVRVAVPELPQGVTCWIDGLQVVDSMSRRPHEKLACVYRRRGYDDIQKTYEVTSAPEQQLPKPLDSEWALKSMLVYIPRVMADVSCWIDGQELWGGDAVTNVFGGKISCVYRRKGYRDVQKKYDVTVADYQELPAPRFDEWELLPITISIPKLPDGVTCLVDGQEVASSLSRKPGDRITAKFSRNGYADVELPYVVTVDEKQSLPVPKADDWSVLAVHVFVPELPKDVTCWMDGRQVAGTMSRYPNEELTCVYRRRGYEDVRKKYKVTEAQNQQLPGPAERDWSLKPVLVWVPQIAADVSCLVDGQEIRGGAAVTNMPGDKIACVYRRKGYKDVQRTHEVIFASYQELPTPRNDEWELLSVTVSLPRLPEGTTCLIDGKPASDNLTRKPGERISAIYRRDGYEDVHKTYEVAFEDGQRLPGPAEGEWKLLKVKVAVPPLPSGVICKVDDVAISGRETLLSPGQHVCEYVRPDYQSQKVDFQVGEDGQAAVPPPSEWTATEGLKSLDAAEIAAKKSDWKEVERLLRMADVQGEANVARRAGFQRQIQLQVDLSKLTEQAVLYYEDESWAQVLRCLADAHRQGYSLSADDRAMVDDSYQKGRNRIATIRKRVMAALAIGKTPPYDLAKLDEEEKQLHAWYAEIAK